MRLSVKTRYALAAMIALAGAQTEEVPCTAVRLSETLHLSVGYLEQVLLCLRRGQLIEASRGSQGGYRLRRAPGQITVLDVMLVMEPAAFARTGSTTPESAPEIDRAAEELVYAPLDRSVQQMLGGISIAWLQEQSAQRSLTGYMYYL